MPSHTHLWRTGGAILVGISFNPLVCKALPLGEEDDAAFAQVMVVLPLVEVYYLAGI